MGQWKSLSRREAGKSQEALRKPGRSQSVYCKKIKEPERYERPRRLVIHIYIYTLQLWKTELKESCAQTISTATPAESAENGRREKCVQTGNFQRTLHKVIQENYALAIWFVFFSISLNLFSRIFFFFFSTALQHLNTMPCFFFVLLSPALCYSSSLPLNLRCACVGMWKKARFEFLCSTEGRKGQTERRKAEIRRKEGANWSKEVARLLCAIECVGS